MSLRKLIKRHVVTIQPDASVKAAALLMKTTQVGDLIVVDGLEQDALPIGILTDRDIVRLVVAHGLSPDTVKVKDIMTADLSTVRESDGLYKAIQIMHDSGVRRLPVLDEDGRLAGILCADDVMGLISTEMRRLIEIVPEQVKNEKTAFNIFTDGFGG